LSDEHLIVDAGDMTATAEQTPSSEPSETIDRATILARLAADAEYYRPELFAIYGITNTASARLPERPFLGWGIDFGEEWGAMFWSPPDRISHLSQSAEQVLRSHQRIGEAHLVWIE
jgi:hypothetical protein